MGVSPWRFESSPEHSKHGLLTVFFYALCSLQPILTCDLPPDDSICSSQNCVLKLLGNQFLCAVNVDRSVGILAKKHQLVQ